MTNLNRFQMFNVLWQYAQIQLPIKMETGPVFKNYKTYSRKPVVCERSESSNNYAVNFLPLHFLCTKKVIITRN